MFQAFARYRFARVFAPGLYLLKRGIYPYGQYGGLGIAKVSFWLKEYSSLLISMRGRGREEKKWGLGGKEREKSK